jgi:hypothetical protein
VARSGCPRDGEIDLTSTKRYTSRSGKCVQIPPRYEPATAPLGGTSSGQRGPPERRFVLKAHKGLDTYPTFENVQIDPKQKPRCAGLLQSPLTDSNRRPPPYHAILLASGSQPAATVFACSRGFAAEAICDRLPPVATTGLHKGSILCCPYWLRVTAEARKRTGTAEARQSRTVPVFFARLE